MLSVTEARTAILNMVRPLPAVTMDAIAALGLFLAEDVTSDIDSPPYDKALMDGYAVRAADLASGSGAFHVIEEITAGRTPQQTVREGQTARIMTGAPVPAGADAVVPVELSQMMPDSTVRLNAEQVRPGMNVLPLGQEMRKGDVVLATGAVLRPQEVGILATVGRTTVQVIPAPTVCVLSTGDEVVEPSRTPGPGQIRNGNGPMLVAQVQQAGGLPRFLGIARDEPEHLRSLITEGLETDVLVLSGGVSAGKLDLVPGTLQELGVKAQFHKVKMKPGKPLLFGTRPRAHGGETLVFGLPGNPVSSLVCFELFVRPALRALRGDRAPGPHTLQAQLTEDFSYRTDRPTYHPARIEAALEDRGWTVRAVPWFGSADLRALARANALLIVPPGDHQYRSGQGATVLPLDGR
jgi:molybdopterin molybdotransferase